MTPTVYMVMNIIIFIFKFQIVHCIIYYLRALGIVWLGPGLNDKE
jgi:hypothetical protein